MYVIPVLRTEYVIWNQYITHLQPFASKTGRNKTVPISEIHVNRTDWYEIIDVLGIILKPRKRFFGEFLFSSIIEKWKSVKMA